MTWRSRFPVHSPLPTAVGVALVVFIAVAFAWLGAVGINTVFPPIKPMRWTTMGSPILVLRESDGSTRIVPENDGGYDSLMRVSLEAPGRKVSVVPKVVAEVPAARWFASSPSRERAVLSFEQGPRFDGGDPATGWPISDAENAALLRAVRRDQPAILPGSLRNSRSLTGQRTLTPGVLHNTLRASVFALALIGAAIGVRLVLIGERRYRRLVVTHCPECGYSLIGLPIVTTCPECGHER